MTIYHFKNFLKFLLNLSYKSQKVYVTDEKALSFWFSIQAKIKKRVGRGGAREKTKFIELIVKVRKKW